MPLTGLQHFLIRAKDVEATKDFYTDVLGLRVGERPPFDFPGYWIYCDDVACVHLIPAGPNEMADAYLEKQDESDGHGSGAIDHLAFGGADLKGFAENLQKRGVEMVHREVPDFGLHQLFVHDPDGVMIEINFPASESVGFEPPT